MNQRNLLSLLVGVFLIIYASGKAQLLPALSTEEPYKVDSVAIEYIGVKNVGEEFIFSNISIGKGMDYSASLVDRSIRSLYDTQFFEFIETKLDQVDERHVKLTFVVKLRYRIESIVFEGNKEIRDRKLKKQIELEEGDILDELKIRNDVETLLEYYRKKGFSRANIEYDIDRNDRLGLGNLTFKIDEGEKVRIRKIEFTGNENIKSSELRDLMETQTYSFWSSWLTGAGRLNPAVFEKDIDNIRNYYKDKGFLDVDIVDSEAVIEYPRPNRIIINIPIEEGRQYHVGEISLTGNAVFPVEVLRGQVKLETGDIFSGSEVSRASAAIRDYYGSRGYLDTRVFAERIPNMETQDIDLKFIITESESFKVGTIRIDGNDKTKSVVILRELALAPGDTFDLVRMRNSQNRLINTRFFEEVNLSPEPTNIPGHRNLRVLVEEKHTGNVVFGAGFSSLERALLFVELTQSNFDLFNHRSFFQGDGQKLRIRLQLGSRSNQFLFSIEEPWLFERELAGGFELFRTETQFNSDLYDEERFGLELYLRKRLFELVEGRLFYRLEQVRIFDVDEAEATPTVLNGRGTQTISKVGFSMTRDTRDSLLNTTSGNRVQLSTEVAGGPFAGDTDYWRLEARGAQFWPIFDFGKQVFSVIGRAGTISSYGGDDVPFFDRFFLGGPQSLRGYDFRDVGPSEIAADGDEEAVGGESMGFFSAEYSFTVVEPLRFALFYDWGFINESDFDLNPSDYNDNWGIGLRLLILGSPLRLDLAFPITSEDYNDQSSQFYFSFGTRF